MTDDEAHRPTLAGPDAAPPPPEPPAAAPTPTVDPGEASWSHPPGSAAHGDGGEVALTERPEVLAGAAFAGGLVFALLLKRLGR